MAVGRRARPSSRLWSRLCWSSCCSATGRAALTSSGAQLDTTRMPGSRGQTRLMHPLPGAYARVFTGGNGRGRGVATVDAGRRQCTRSDDLDADQCDERRGRWCRVPRLFGGRSASASTASPEGHACPIRPSGIRPPRDRGTPTTDTQLARTRRTDPRYARPFGSTADLATPASDPQSPNGPPHSPTRSRSSRPPTNGRQPAIDLVSHHPVSRCGRTHEQRTGPGPRRARRV